MNLKNKGKTNKRTNSKAGNANNPGNTSNQQTPEMLLQNAGNPNMLMNTGTMGSNNRVAATQLENNSGTFSNQNIQNSFGKFYF